MNGLASAGPRARGRERRLEVTGLIYLLVLAALIWFSIASYRHVFGNHVTVVVQARAAGQQLNVGGDVRMNGAIVGRVSAVKTSSTGTAISLQIDGDDSRRIPTDVQARILPTTLFGQKYVELTSSSNAAAGHLVDGSVIAEDRTAETTELTDVIDDLDPVLTAIRPARLAAALGGIADGLSGRGDDLGRLLAGGGNYLRALNADTGLFERDLNLLRTVSGQYADNTADLLAVARNATVTSRTLIAGNPAADFIAALTGTSQSGSALLRTNAGLIAESARLARPTAELLAEYSPELVCTIQGFLALEALSAKQIRNNSFQGHFTVGKQTRGYTAADALVLGDLGAGPHCRGLPNPPVPYGPVNLNDGAGNTDLFGMFGGGS